MPEKEVNAKWKTNGGSKYNIVTETCDIHNAETAKKNETNVSVENPDTNKTDTDVTVPNVVGKTEADAKNELSALGLTVIISYDEKATQNNGKVASQSYKAGTVVAKNAKITIVVNKGKETPATPTPPANPTTLTAPGNTQTPATN